MTCDFRLKFKNDFGNLMRQAEKENKAMDEKKSIALDFLKSAKQKAADAGYTNIDEYLQEWAKFVDWRLLKSGVPPLGSLYILNTIKNPTEHTSDVIKSNNTTTSLDVTVTTKKEFRKDFLERIYDGADNARLQAVKSAEYNFTRALLVDRELGKIIKNELELNLGIREYQLRLLDTVFKYLKSYYSKKKNQLGNVSYGIYDNEQLQMYKDGEYTGVFELLFPTASTVFNTFDRRRIITEYQYLTESLKAFNAFQTLLHFDEFLLNSFGDAINISNMNVRFSSNKDRYKVASKATNMFWSNLKDDDIDLARSINNVSKLLVTSTRMYDFNTGQILPDTYLNFGQFISVICKLKDLAWNRPLTWGIKLNNKLARKREYDLSSLSAPTREYIESLGKNATLATIINKTREDSRRAYSALFELLSSKELRPQLSEILDKFNNEEKNVIYSLNEELFKAEGNSLRNILDIEGYSKESIDYLHYALQTSDSTWLVKNCLYFQDPETRLTIIRTLLNSNILNILRRLNDILNIQNSPETNTVDKKYNAGYSKSNGFRFSLNNHLVEIDNLGRITIDKKPLLDSIDSIEAMGFIDEMLHLNFLNNPKYFDNYVSVSKGSRKQALALLFQFAAELLHGQYAIRLINELLKENKDTDLTKLEKIEKYAKLYYSTEYYGEPKVNQSYKTIDIIPQKLLTTLESLAEANAITEGTTTATLVNDSEGKALSTSTSSRFLSAFELLLEKIRETLASPAHDFAIVSDPYTFIDIQTVRELKTADGESKPYIQFSTREFLESSILYDFIQPLIATLNKKYDLVKSGLFAFTPSVNSDKNTVSKLLVNLRHELMKLTDPATGEQLYKDPNTAIIEFIKSNPLAFYNYINKELGSYYTKLFKKLNSDLYSLSLSVVFKSIFGNNFVLKYNKESFNLFNQLLAQYNKQALILGKQTYTPREVFDAASRDTKVKINELLHVIFNGNNILVNNSIFSLYHRHNNNLDVLDKYHIPNINLFFKYKNAELLLSLVNNKVKIDLVTNKELLLFLKDNGLLDWISPSGKLVFAKYRGTNITSESDFHLIENNYPEVKNFLKGRKLKNNPHILANQLVLNPIIEKYNLLSYLYSLEFILSTVGSHVNHPNKSKSGVPIIWGHPAIGKTYALDNLGGDKLFIDWDVEFNRKRDLWISDQSKTPLGSKAFKLAKNEYLINWQNHPEFLEFVKLEWGKAKQKAILENKILIASPAMLLQLFPNDFTKIITMSKEDFVKRGLARGDSDPTSWKDSIDTILATVKNIPTIEVKEGEYLQHLVESKQLSEDISQLYLNFLGDEAARFKAQDKRNVSYTASMYEFALNLKNGIPFKYNIAVVQDINDLVYNIAGDLAVVKPFDGATIVNPWIVHLENNSLNGERAGIHKKQFVHFYDVPTGTGGIIKTAGFGITNSLMVNSPFLERIMKNMTNKPWKKKSGETVVLDLTKRIQDSTSSHNSINYPIAYKKPFKENGKWVDHYFKVTGIEYLGNGTYKLTTIQVTENGTEVGLPFPDVVSGIDTNYKAWKYLFKGLDSVGINNDESRSLNLTPLGRELSIINMVNAINECGFLVEGYTKAEDLNSFDQPMKYSDDHYLVTEGAIKQGPANYNEKKWYYQEGDYNSYEIEMNQAGILLDKEHHADDSEISMMTLVISACAALGYTWDESNKMYKALYRLAKLGIAPISESLKKALETEDGKSEFDKVLTKIVIKNLSNGSSTKDGVIYNIAYDLIEKYRSGELIGDADIENNPIPISDPVLFNKIQSSLASILNSTAIKLKFSGILSVLVPSHEVIKLYGGKLKSDFVNFEEEIKDLQAQYDKNPLNVTLVEIGRTYKLMNLNGEVIDRFIVQAPYMKDKHRKNVYGNPNLKYTDYYTLREQLNNPEYLGTYLVEDITEGRNLGAYFCSFSDAFGNSYSFYDLTDSYNLYHGTVKDRKYLLNTLANLKNGGLVSVTVDGVTKIVTINNLNIKPYEVIMPKTMASKLGLTYKDSVDSLLNNPDVFKKKFVNNLANKTTDNNFTIALKKLNGKHSYILSRKLFESQRPKLSLLTTDYLRVDPDGNIYRVNEDGDYLYKMSSLNDLIYITDEGLEVIVTDDINYYLDNSLYNMLYVSLKATLELFSDIYRYSKKSLNKSLKKWKRAIDHNNESEYDVRNARQRNNQLGNVEFINGKFVSDGVELKGENLDIINLLGNELYNSFKKSLDIIAARIPAQSMQSFMPMRVVGYEDFDINTAYVSTHQIWLLGSDYDIDAVSLLTFELGNNGKFIGWSPYFDESSEERFKLSTELGYPTGLEAKLLTMAERFGVEGPTRDLLEGYVTTLFSSFNFAENKDIILLVDNYDSDDVLFKSFIDMINEISEVGLLDFNNLDSTDLNEITDAFNSLYNKNLTRNQMSQLFNQIKEIVDLHNLYTNNLESFTKNYIVELMFRVAMNPANLIEALTSVDLTTDEPKEIANKSEAGKALKNATPGNIGNIYLSIEDNHVGKDVIGISAVGLKAFFAITQYVNTILNSSSPKDIISKLLGKPIRFGGRFDENNVWIPNTYYTIANANYKVNDPSSEAYKRNIKENNLILERLQSLSNKDAALMLSALLSLATDNAKELCLSKLNANSKMAGMYIYGLTMGISYEDLGKLLMSDIGNTVSTLLKGSIISEELKLNSVLKVLEYLNNPLANIKTLYSSKRLWKFNTGKLDNRKVWNTLSGTFTANFRGLKGDYLLEYIKSHDITEWKDFDEFLKSCLDLIKSGKKPLNDIIATLDSLRAYVSTGEIAKIDLNPYLLNQAIDSIIESFLYVDLIALTNNTLWEGAFDDFITLYEGSEELTILGRLLGANQGVKSTDVDYLKFIDNLETIIEKRAKLLDDLNKLRTDKKDIKSIDKTDLDLDFQKFMLDENYRLEKIDIYESIKTSFNPLDILEIVPHYKGYLETAFTKHGSLVASSIKYRTTYKLLKDKKVKDITLGLKVDLKIKAISDLCNYKSILEYLLGKSFYISPGTDLIYLEDTESTTKVPVTVPTKVFLGTLGGNATFKNWVEKEVIPNLKEGYNNSERTFKNPSILNNEFIRSLKPNIYTKNPNKNSSISWATSINMSPRNDEDRTILLRVRLEFDSLTTSYTVNGFSLPIKDIFYLYNLIAYNGKLGLGTLTNIFDNYINSAEPRKFRKSLKKSDLSDKEYEFTEGELSSWLALIESPFISRNSYIYFKNKNELRVDLLRKEDSELDDNTLSSIAEEAYGGINTSEFGSYVMNGSIAKIDTNLILTIPTSSDIYNIATIPINELNWEVKYNPVTQTIHSISNKDLKLDLKIINYLNDNLERAIEYDSTAKVHKLKSDVITELIENEFKGCNK